jgi:hypothetical protein
LRRPTLPRAVAVALAAGALILGSLAFAGGTTAAIKIAPTTTCGNSVDNTGGLGRICQVTIINRITASGSSAKVTVRECHGAAGDPNAACTTRISNLHAAVTKVTQCNSSINGGGGTLRCSVKVTNNFVNMATGATAATVNQCVGSGGGITTNCDPFPATTTGATVTQCNKSANGGTLVGLRCTVTGTKPSSHGVRINQCNGSANGGGALVICSASIVNHRVSASTSGGTSGGGTSGGGSPTGPPTDTIETTPSSTGTSSPMPLVLVGIFLLGLVVVIRRSLAIGSR